MSLPKTLIQDRILRCPLDENEKLKLNTSFVEHFLAMIEGILSTHGDREVLINADLGLRGLEHDKVSRRCLRLSEVSPKAQKAARILYKFGLRKNDVAQLALPNTTEYLPLVLGTWLCQGIASLVDDTLSMMEYFQRIHTTEPKVILCWRENLKNLFKAREESGLGDKITLFLMDYDAVHDLPRKVFAFHQLLREDATEYPDPPKHIESDLYRTGALVWSSGTTGTSKAVRRTFKSFEPYMKKNDIAPAKCLATTCNFHISGFCFQLSTFTGPTKTLVMFPLASLTEDSGEKLVRAISKYKSQFFLGRRGHVMALAHVQSVLDDLDVSSLELVSSSGAIISSRVENMIRTKFPSVKAIPNFYALTESGGVLAISSGQNNFGYLTPGWQVKIVDRKSGLPLGPGEMGEIYIKSEICTPGYYKRPEEDEKLFAEDGFLRTGDLGHYDEDGVLYFDGRVKDLINMKGLHVCPSEIERVIEDHPEVKDVAVFGRIIQDSNDVVVTALVVKHKPDSFVTEQDIVDFVDKSNLEDYKKLKGGVVFVPEIPQSITGKIIRRSMQEIYDELIKK